MKYTRFEELPVWQAAIEFAIKVFELTNKVDFRGVGDVKNQLERAAVSVSNNIAEGFERGTTTELINFLYIARGSAGECRSMLYLCEKLAQFNNFKSEISNLKSRGESISKQLHGWIESLKNTEIKGVKFLTEKERTKIRQISEDKEFREALQKITRGEKIDWDKI
ncbi:MAG: four helix bundle protein [Pyrinomonadaceae bacterium]